MTDLGKYLPEYIMQIIINNYGLIDIELDIITKILRFIVYLLLIKTYIDN